MNGTDEMTISLKDLLYRILLRWRLILVWLTLGAVLFGAVGYMKNTKAAKKPAERVPLTAAEQIKKLESELTDNEIDVVQAAVKTYGDFQKSGELLNEYLSGSVRMKFDPSRIPTLKLQYLIDNHYEAVYPVVASKDHTGDILTSYAGKILNASVYEEMAEVLAESMEAECDASYVRELVSAEGAGNILIIVIHGLSEEDCRALSPIIQEAVRENTGELQEIYGDFDITLIQESYYENVSPELITEQRQKRDEYNGLISSMNGLANNMTDPQKEYYYALLADSEGEKEETETLPEAEQPAENIQVELFHKKYILLGAAAGVFLACCYLACRYLFSARLRVREDLEECFGIPSLGTLSAARPKRRFLNVVDRWISSCFEEKSRQFSEEECIRMICAGVRIGAKKADMKSVYLTGVCSDEACEQMKALLCGKMKADIASVQYGKSVVCDPESLEAMAAADGVVFVERIGGSRYDDLRKEVEICRQNQVKIIGSVTIS